MKVVSQLALHCVQETALGALTVQQAQKICQLCCNDIESALAQGPGVKFPVLDMLAQLGSGGTHSNNMWAELSKKLKTPQVNAAVSSTTLPVRKPRSEQTHPDIILYRPVSVDILYPHAMFARLFNDYPEAFKLRVRPSDEETEFFWHSMQGSPQLENHPVLLRENYTRQAVPIALHGDGVPTTGVGKSWGKSMDSWHWSSMLSKGDTLSISFLIMSMFQNLFANGRVGNTKTVFWKRMRCAFFVRAKSFHI
jgi:hypothetical protein